MATSWLAEIDVNQKQEESSDDEETKLAKEDPTLPVQKDLGKANTQCRRISNTVVGQVTWKQAVEGR